MTVHCADCKGFYCRGGTKEGTPDHCPMGDDFPAFSELYPEGPKLEVMHQAAVVEARGYCRWTRLKEVAEFAALMGHRTIGLAHCPDMAGEARKVAETLEAFGLIPTLPSPSSVSDPSAVARQFADEGTELNILTGMCVAHEVVFLKTTHAPVVGLIARDTRLRHNPVAALYTSRSYLKDELFGHWPKADRKAPYERGEGVFEDLSCNGEENGGAVRSRLAEAMDFAQGVGAQHIGLSFCVGFKEEAKTLTRLLKTNGFTVSSVCCKTGAVPKEEAGIGDEGKVRPGTPEMICNPVAQGELLNRDGVQLALVLGQCVGHDAATLRTLHAPALCLVTKDRVLAHNTVAALAGQKLATPLDGSWRT